MAKTLARGQVTVIDLNDAKAVQCFLQSNQSDSQLFDPATNAASPDFSTSNLVISPRVYVTGSADNVISKCSDFSWIIDGSAFATGQSSVTLNATAPNNTTIGCSLGTNGVLTISKNLIKDSLTLSFECNYRETSDANSPITHLTAQKVVIRTTVAGTLFQCIMTTPKGDTFDANVASTASLSAVCTAYHGATECTGDSVTYQWYYLNSDGNFAVKTGATAKTLSVQRDDVLNFQTFKCVVTDATDTSKKCEAIATFRDLTDPYRVDLVVPGGETIKNGVGSVTINARVYRGTELMESENTDDDDIAFYYKWTKYDAEGNLSNFVSSSSPYKRGNGLNQLVVSSSEVTDKSTFFCEVSRKSNTSVIIAREQVTITDLNDGEIIKPNLFGYDCALNLSKGMIAHTSDGFFAYCEARTDSSTGKAETFYLVQNKNTIGSKYPAGTYAITCKVKVIPIANMPTSFAMRVTMSGTQLDDTSVYPEGYDALTKCLVNREYSFKVKERRDAEDKPFLAIDGLNTSSKFIVVVKEWKFENAEGVSTVGTPFDGLAASTVPQGANNFLRSADFGGSKWTVGGSVQSNAFQGQYSCGRSVSTGWYEMCKQSTSLKVNTWYTVSWYQKKSNSSSTASIRVAAVGTASKAYYAAYYCSQDDVFKKLSGDDPDSTHALSTQWERHIFVFYVPTGGTYDLTFYGTSNVAESVYIAMPKIEEGDSPTAWQKNESDRQGERGVGITSITELYAYGTESTPTTFGTTVLNPSATAGQQYVWNKERITYSDASTDDTSPHIVSRWLADGKTISSYIEKYYVSTSASVPDDSLFGYQNNLAGAVATMSSTNKFLWNLEVAKYDDNTNGPTTKRLIAVYGNKGDDGKNPFIGDGTGGYEDGYWYYWDDEQNKYVKGGKAQGEAGPAGDPTLPNLYGYTNVLSQAYAVHTEDGFAWRVTKATADSGSSVPYSNPKVTGAKYYAEIDITRLGVKEWIPNGKTVSISCDVELRSTGTSYSRLNIMMRTWFWTDKGGTHTLADQASTGNTYHVAAKGLLSGASFPLLIIGGFTTSSPNLLVVVSNLKIEYSSSLSGVSTPFSGLASEMLPQRGNLLIDSVFSNKSAWNDFHGQMASSLYSGVQGLQMAGNYIAIGLSSTTTAQPTSWRKVNVGSSASNPSFSNTSGSKQYVWLGILDKNGTVLRAKCAKYEVPSGGPVYPSYVETSLTGSSTKDDEWFSPTQMGNIGFVTTYMRYYYDNQYMVSDMYVNMVVQTMSKLKTNTWYTLSFWHRESAQGKLAVYWYYTNESGSNYPVSVTDGVELHDGTASKSNALLRHDIYSGDPSTAWKRHVITFRTPSSAVDSSRLQFRVYDVNDNYLCMPKVEEGDYATDFCVNEADKVGAQIRPRGIWSASEVYYNNNEYRDVVEWRATASESYVHYAVRRGVGTVPAGSSYSPANTNYWEKASEYQFVATDLLLSNKIYTSVLTAINAHVNELILNKANAYAKNAQGAFAGSPTVSIDGNTGILTAKGCTFENAIFSGFIQKTKTIVNSSNIGTYLTEGDLGYEWKIEKVGSWVEVQNLGLNDSLFSIVPSFDNALYGSGSYDSIRKYVGTSILIYNKSGYAISFTGSLATVDNPTTFNSFSVSTGNMALLECKVAIVGGKECVYWKIAIGQTRT